MRQAQIIMSDIAKTSPRRLRLSSSKGLVVFTVLLIGMVAYVSQLRPTFDKLAILHLDDCALPCWIGIVPGQTTIGEAEALIRAGYSGENFDVEVEEWHNEYSRGYSIKLSDKHLPRSIFVYINSGTSEFTEQTIVNEIKFYFYSETETQRYVPTVIDYMDVLGEPDCMSSEWGFHRAWPAMRYSQGQISISFGTEAFQVNPNMNAGLILRNSSGWCSPTTAVSWRGFNVDYRDEFLATMLP